MRIKLVLIVINLFICVQLAAAEELKNNHPNNGNSKDVFSFELHGPIRFLQFLKELPNSLPNHWYIAENVPEGWIKKEGIPYLVEKLDSKEDCANVNSSFSSYRGQRSTIGCEAAYFNHGLSRQTLSSLANFYIHFSRFYTTL